MIRGTVVIHCMYCLGKTSCNLCCLWCTACGQYVFKNYSFGVYSFAYGSWGDRHNVLTICSPIEEYTYFENHL